MTKIDKIETEAEAITLVEVFRPLTEDKVYYSESFGEYYLVFICEGGTPRE